MTHSPPPDDILVAIRRDLVSALKKTERQMVERGTMPANQRTLTYNDRQRLKEVARRCVAENKRTST
jgi:sugar-specific transcriptional regulator TrmB